MNLKIISFLKPPDPWKLPVILLLGIFVGMGCYILYIANVTSYLSDKPETCINCHIMAPQYATWSHSSHREVTNCNDCHVPQNNVFNMFYFKAMDGLRHSTIFTLRAEPQVIFIKEAGQKVVHNNCKRCHEPLINNTKLATMMPDRHWEFDDRHCWECHRETPHGRVNSLSSVPNARVPLLTSPVPDWLKPEKENK
jgi:cytochrome c nitrite reductase small subunit